MNGTPSNIWDFVIDGLFVEYMVALLAALAATTNTFSALLFSIFGTTVEEELTSVSYGWKSDLQLSLNNSATMLADVVETEGTVYPTGQYIVMFVLFIGSVLGIVTYAMGSIRYARATPIAPVA